MNVPPKFVPALSVAVIVVVVIPAPEILYEPVRWPELSPSM
jgi:hypothetical protein